MVGDGIVIFLGLLVIALRNENSSTDISCIFLSFRTTPTVTGSTTFLPSMVNQITVLPGIFHSNPSKALTKLWQNTGRLISPSVTTSTPALSWIATASLTALSSVSVSSL